MEQSKTLEWRMYGLVPYNISPIQQAIQYGHGVVEYMMKYMRMLPNGSSGGHIHIVHHWADKHKTFIILNGGTTNKRLDKQGSLNLHMQWLKANHIHHSTFNEPDLGDQLTAVCFLADERVFDNKKYPLFKEWLLSKYSFTTEYLMSIETALNKFPKEYEEYLELVGGKTNFALKHWLIQFKLA